MWLIQKLNVKVALSRDSKVGVTPGIGTEFKPALPVLLGPEGVVH
jgi:hypothetical protein